MISIYIDTALLGFPNYGAEPEVAARLLERLEYFSILVSSATAIRLVIADNFEDLLYENELGPTEEGISGFLEFVGLSHVYNWQDLFRAHVGIADRATRARYACPVDVTALRSFETVPELPDDLGPVLLKSETERVLASVAASDLLEPTWHFGSSIEGDVGNRVQVKAEIAAFQSVTEPKPDPQPIISHEVRLVTSARQFISEECSQLLWKTAKNAEDLHLSIALGALAVLNKGKAQAKLEDLHPFIIGSEFLPSLERNQSANNGRFSNLMRTVCCQIVARACEKKTKPFGLKTQVLRQTDQALGWRVHVTKDKEALRLMYWTSGDFLEFANVGPKQELIIQEGSQVGASKCDFSEIL